MDNLAIQELNELSISNCPVLKKVYCDGIKFRKLDINACRSLKELNIYRSQLVDLDLSDTPNLEVIELPSNLFLNRLNLQNNQKLRKLDISFTNLRELDLSCLTELKKLEVSCSQLTKLNVDGCFNLKKLNC